MILYNRYGSRNAQDEPERAQIANDLSPTPYFLLAASEGVCDEMRDTLGHYRTEPEARAAAKGPGHYVVSRVDADGSITVLISFTRRPPCQRACCT
jgi:hypothetical protein